MPDGYDLTKHDLEKAVSDVRGGLSSAQESTGGMPPKIPDLGPLTPAFGSVASDLMMATANTLGLVQRAGDDLDQCVASYSRNEEASADVFKNIQRDR
ncbi:hypothetical protein [Sciscionella sediminilitoris]|uniref:hypothetical protein n=1 Tax=Sciscionella sediminilitoris TaxID=1445613 RepID=UPI0004DEFE6C|nr:hypothetical protein [Sciscionella sp. SE31]